MTDTPSTVLLTRIVLRNYRSIAACEVSPGALTFLVGPNGAGKSNFVDALRFVADSLRDTVDDAFRERGGVRAVPRRGTGRTASFGLRIEFDLGGTTGHFAFEIRAEGRGGYRIRREECAILESDGASWHYETVDGVMRSSNIVRPPGAVAGRFYLSRASHVPEFQPAYRALAGMGFYNFDPQSMRTLHRSDAGDLLSRDGGNLASVLSRLADRDPEIVKRIEGYLAAVVDGVEGIRTRRYGSEDRLEFLQRTGATTRPTRFESVSLSDGALRALGVLTGLFQGTGNADGPRLVGIEEPESTLHPSAAGALLDALRDASENAQVLVTTHSPELLDDKDLTADELLAVVATDGRSRVGRIDEAGRNTLRQRLCTPGELLRMGQIRPDPKTFGTEAARPRLFGEAVRAGNAVPVDAPSVHRRVPS